MSSSRPSTLPLQLQVLYGNGRKRTMLLRPGLVIGGEPSADVVIKERGVYAAHAKIELGPDGEMIVRCRDGAHVTLPDGANYPHLRLHPGATFHVGSYKFVCMETAVLQVRPEAVAGDGAIHCMHCGQDISHSPPSARFCARCGNPLPGPADLMNELLAQDARNLSADNGNAAAPGADPVRTRLGKLYEHLRDSDKPVDGDVHSLMLLGYGNALFNLGWQYEKGAGRFRNLREALRYYRKAARLGNPVARARVDADPANSPAPADAPNDRDSAITPPPTTDRSEA